MRILLLSSFFFSIGAFAQVQDANIWMSATVNADLTKKFSASYANEVRFYKNATTLDSYINEIGFGYELIKSLDLGIDYRYSRKDQEGYYEGINRIGADLSYTYKLENAGLRIKARARYQLPFNRLGVINNAIYPDNRNVFRFKISAKYTPVNLPKIQPFLSYEIYKAAKPKNPYNAIDSYRLTFGVSFDLPKRHALDLYYMLEREYRATPALNHVYGIQYSYELFKDPIFEPKKN